MEHSEAVDLGRRIERESGYDMLVDGVFPDGKQYFVSMRKYPGHFEHFYSEADWQRYKEQAGWQELMQWRPQPGGEQQ